MDDEKQLNPDENPEEKTPEEPSDESKSLSPEAEAVAANQPGDSEEPDLDKAAQELNESLEKAKEEPAPEEEAHVEEEKPDEPGASVEEPAPEEPKEKGKAKEEPAPPKKIGKEKTKRKSNVKFLMIMGLSLAGLFVLFVVLMVLVIAGGGADSPVLTSLGIDASGIKSFLLTIINLSFGFLALLFFVLGVIGVFRLLFAKKGDKDAKKHGLRMTLVGLIPLVFVMIVWMLLYNFISGIEISAERVKAEIVILEPTELEHLSAPIEITFSSENVIKALQAGDLSVTSAKWDFDGDGVFETEPTEFTVSYLYNLQGTINVGLEVGVEGEDMPRVYNYLLVIEEALFGAEPTKGTAPLEVAFDASALIPEGTKVQSMDWDFDGDDTYELTGKDNLRPRYTFEQIGVYNVHLRVVDQNNLVENYYRDIEIVPGDRPLLSAEIDASPGFTGTVPLQIRFDGGNSESVKGSIVNYEWDFGDGSQLQVGKSVTHIYHEPGIYSVTLTVREDTGKTASETLEVEAKTISSEPEARIETDPPADVESNLSGEIPFKISFDASSSTDADGDIVEYEWDFGLDGVTQVGQKVEFTYETAGTYTVTLVVRDVQEQESSALLTVTVEEPGVRAIISADPEEGTAPLTVNFDGSSSSAFTGNIVSYEWDFGDGSPSTITSAKISHKYDQVGTYAVKLIVTTNENEVAEMEKQIYVREIPLRACFSPSRRSGEPPLAVTFDAKCSTGAVATYRWDFGDGEDSDSRKPSHTFENPGTYNVTLEVSDDKNNVSDFGDVIVVEGTLE